MRNNNLTLSLAALSLAIASAQHLGAVTITSGDLGVLGSTTNSTGTLSNQGTVLEDTFSLSAGSNLTVYTSSYGGGTNVDGSSATPGGFMSSLVLYSSTGTYVAGDTFPSPNGKTDPATGLVGDSYLSATGLASGTYILALSDFLVQQPTTATNLSDGFINYGGGAAFIDAQGNTRTGNYSLNLTATPLASTATPEPATFFLVIPALLGAIALRRRSVSAS